MSDVTTDVQPQTEAPSGLPSDVAEQQQAIKDWDGLVAKDPEYMKQFKSLEDFQSKYKELHKQYSNTVREYKDKEKKTVAEQEAQQQTIAKQQEQQQVVMDLVPQFLQNNMQLTPEMEAVLTEQGLDIRDVKLGAIELRERISNAHAVVGGQQEYEAMISWGRENLTEAQKKTFDKDIQCGMSDFAIRGMYSMYQEANKDGGDRIRGESTQVGIKPYASKAELFADKRYIESIRGKNDRVAIERFNARKRLTPDSVIFG